MENDIILKNLIFMRNFYEENDVSNFDMLNMRLASYISMKYGIRLSYYDIRQFLQQNEKFCQYTS